MTALSCSQTGLIDQSMATKYSVPSSNWTDEEALRVLCVYSPHRLACFGENYREATQKQPWDPDFAKQLREALRKRTVSEELKISIVNALRRHQQNAKLCGALYLVVQSAEVVFRNALSSAVGKLFGSRWLITALGAITPGERDQIDKKSPLATSGFLESADFIEIKKAAGSRHEKYLEPDQNTTRNNSNVLAELNFGFWVSLVSEHRKPPRKSNKQTWQGLWQGLIVDIYIPDAKVEKNRNCLHQLLTNANELRNGIAHQYPIWTCKDTRGLRHPAWDHATFLIHRCSLLYDLIDAISPKAAEATKQYDTLFYQELKKMFPDSRQLEM